MISFFHAVADGAWILFGGGTAFQGNCQGLFFSVYDEKKKTDVKLLDQPIHFTDEHTETSTILSLPLNY